MTWLTSVLIQYEIFYAKGKILGRCYPEKEIMTK
jgi:hypothetical protein